MAGLEERKRATPMLLHPISLVFYRTILIVKQYYNEDTLQPPLLGILQ